MSDFLSALSLFAKCDIGCEAGVGRMMRSVVDNVDRIEVGGKFLG